MPIYADTLIMMVELHAWGHTFDRLVTSRSRLSARYQPIPARHKALCISEMFHLTRISALCTHGLVILHQRFKTSASGSCPQRFTFPADGRLRSFVQPPDAGK